MHTIHGASHGNKPYKKFTKLVLQSSFSSISSQLVIIQTSENYFGTIRCCQSQDVCRHLPFHFSYFSIILVIYNVEITLKTPIVVSQEVSVVPYLWNIFATCCLVQKS